VSTLFLIRHGLTAQTGTILYGRTAGIGLDDRGRAQARALATRFEGIRLTAVYTSPLERCVETVEPLAAANRLTVVRSNALIEMDAGSWTGQRLARLRRRREWAEIQGTPSTFAFPGGEGFAEAQGRAVAEVRRIASRHARGRVAIATHGDIVRMIAAHLLGTPLDRFQSVVIDTASVSVVTMHRGTGRVLLLNDAGGLARFARDHVPPWETAADANGGEVRG
jgi:probable phosphoglycerate mutase